MARPKGTTKDGLKYLNEEQLKRFSDSVKAGKSIRDFVLFSLCLRYGLRVSELVGIKLQDINMEAEQITVHGLKNGQVRTYDLTNGEECYRPDREDVLFQKLKQWIRNGRKKVDPKGMNPYLFPSAIYADKSVTADSAKFAFKKYLALAGLPEEFSIHSLRHSCAMLLVRANWSGIRLQKYLRHSALQSTEIYFDQVEMEGDDEKASKEFGRFF